MTFLQYLNGLSKKAAVSLIIIGCVVFTVFSQKTGTQQKNCCYGNPGFVGEPINLNVVNADVRDILNYITEQYGINFVIDKSVSKVPVTVNINDVPWNIALDAILSSQELGVQVKGAILRIASSKNLAEERKIQEEIDAAKLDASPLYTEFVRLNYASASGGGSGPSFSTGTASSSGGGGGTGTGSNAVGLLPIIKRRLSRRGAIEIDPRSNSLIITDVRENIDAIRQLVAILDQPEAQVEVEARVVIASRDFSRDIGVQLSGLVIGNKVGENGQGSYNAGGNLVSGITNSVLRLTTGVFGTAQLNLLITAGENKGQAKTIATPRVTTLNNRKATVESGQQIPIVTTQAGGTTGDPIFTTTYVSVPLKLEVTPQVTGDGVVVLDVVVENSSVSSNVGSGGSTAPPISTQRTQVNVMVPDGGTTVIGGAMVDVEGETLFRTPGLSKIPVVGNLFKRKAVARTTSEIIFFLTPRISRPDYTSTAGKTGDVPRSTTILQPVPLGNPPSNSDMRPSDPTVQPLTVQQVVPAPQPTPIKP